MNNAMKKISVYLVLAVFLSVLGCTGQQGSVIVVKNSLDIPRQFETVEIQKSTVTLSDSQDFENLGVKDLKTNRILVSQFVDSDLDGVMDVLLFQPEMEANSERQFELVKVAPEERPDTIEYCYSRFVPERTDDYAWENNKVAFRTFGPTAQKMVEDSVKGGTLTSAIDAWLKRVDYPIINKWYKDNDAELGAYHKDRGEGLDNFHVGVSRGVGGIAVKKDTVYYFSKNFTTWKTITNGPIRTSFVLEYADWDADGQAISETKHISLDYGGNLSKVVVDISGTSSIYVGLTLHKKDGLTTQNVKSGWIAYWEPLDDSELGTGIVAPNNRMTASELYDTSAKDLSNLYAQIQVDNGKAVYYSGFGWKKAGEFTTKEKWENYLELFSLKVNNPLTIEFK